MAFQSQTGPQTVGDSSRLPKKHVAVATYQAAYTTAYYQHYQQYVSQAYQQQYQRQQHSFASQLAAPPPPPPEDSQVAPLPPSTGYHGHFSTDACRAKSPSSVVHIAAYTTSDGQMWHDDAPVASTAAIASVRPSHATDVEESKDKFPCELCDVPFSSQQEYQTHCSSMMHKERQKGGWSSKKKYSQPPTIMTRPLHSTNDDTRHECSVCSMRFSSLMAYNAHCRSTSHAQKQIAEASTNLSKSSSLEDVASANSADDDWSHCSLCNVDFKSLKEYNMHCRGMIHSQKQMDLANRMSCLGADGGLAAAATVDMPECQSCEMKFSRQDEFLMHLRSEVHRTHVARAQCLTASTSKGNASAGEREPGELPSHYVCEVCKISCSSLGTYETHLNGKKHKKVVQRMTTGTAVHHTSPCDQSAEMEGLGLLGPTGRPAFIQAHVDAYLLQPIIGASYVTEYLLRANMEPKYMCELCEAKCDARTLISHLTGFKHRVKIFKKEGVQYGDVTTKGLKGSQQTEMAERLAAQVELQLGRGFVKQVIGCLPRPMRKPLPEMSAMMAETNASQEEAWGDDWEEPTMSLFRRRANAESINLNCLKKRTPIKQDHVDDGFLIRSSRTLLADPPTLMPESRQCVSVPLIHEVPERMPMPRPPIRATRAALPGRVLRPLLKTPDDVGFSATRQRAPLIDVCGTPFPDKNPFTQTSGTVPQWSVPNALRPPRVKFGLLERGSVIRPSDAPLIDEKSTGWSRGTSYSFSEDRCKWPPQPSSGATVERSDEYSAQCHRAVAYDDIFSNPEIAKRPKLGADYGSYEGTSRILESGDRQLDKEWSYADGKSTTNPVKPFYAGTVNVEPEAADERSTSATLPLAANSKPEGLLQKLVSNLATGSVATHSDKDVEVVSKVTNALTQALIKYRLQKVLGDMQ